MHLIHSTPYLVALASAASKTTTTAKSTGSGSSAFLLVVVVLFVLLYFLLIRPNQRRRMQAVRQSRSYGVSDEVVAGGMVGRVARLGDGQVEVEVSDGVVVSFVPQAVQLLSSYQAAQAGRGGGLFGGGASAGTGGRAGAGGAASAMRGSPGLGSSGDGEDVSGGVQLGGPEHGAAADAWLGTPEEGGGEGTGDEGLGPWSSTGGTAAQGGGTAS